MTRAGQKLRLLVLDDQALFRSGLARALSMEPDMDVVGECESVGDAVLFVQDNQVDVMLLDLDLSGEAGQDFLARTTPESRPKVLVVAGEITHFHVELLLRAGVDGMLLKTESLPELCDAIRRVAAGEKVLDSEWLKPLLERKRSRVTGHQGPFTSREREVLLGVVQGLSSKEIAHRSVSSEAAVKSVIQQLFQKTGTRSRAQLVRLTIETGALNES